MNRFLKEVTWLRPLKVATSLEVHITLEVQEDGDITFDIFSTQDDAVQIYSQGRAELLETTVAEAPRIDVVAARQQCTEHLTQAACYPLFAKQGVTLGASFQVLNALQTGAGIAVGSLSVPGQAAPGYTWLPNLVDGAAQTGVWLASDGAVALPFAVNRVEQWGVLPLEDAWVVAKPAANDSRAVRKLDIVIAHADGRIALRLSGFSVRAYEVKAPAETVLLASQWSVQALPSSAIAIPPTGSKYALHRILLADMGEPDNATIIDHLAAALPDTQCTRLMATGTLAVRYTHYAQQLLEQLQRDVVAHPGKPMLIQLVTPNDGEAAVLQGLGGLLRSAQQEYPQLSIQMMAMEADVSASLLAQRLQAEAVLPTPVVRYVEVQREAQREVAALALLETTDVAVPPWRDGGVYLITGGLGGLGQIFASAAAQDRKPVLILTGRSALTPLLNDQLAALRGSGARVAYHAVDVSDTAAVTALVASVVAEYGQLNGVIHSAGVLRDGLLATKTAHQLREVFASKVAGLAALDQATRNIALDWFMLCSSIAGVMGNAGQTDYASANGFMDAYAQYRQDLVAQGQRQGRTVSVSWPLWAEGAMQVDAATREQMQRSTGFVALPTQDGLTALSHALTQNAVHVVVGYGDRTRMLERLRLARAQQALPAATPKVNLSEGAVNVLQTQIAQALTGLISGQLNIASEHLEPETPLADFGFDSITLTTFGNTLNSTYGLALSPTIFFEYPSIAKLSSYLLREQRTAMEKSFKTTEDAATVDADSSINTNQHPTPVAKSAPLSARFRRAHVAVSPAPANIAAEPIAIIGMSGCFALSEDVDALWVNLMAERNCITELRPQRWGNAAIPTVRHAGVIENMDMFDPLFFGISPREAQAMDPQQRLLMTYVHKAIEDAGYSVQSLSGSATALLVGTASTGYANLLEQSGEPIAGHSAPGIACSIGPNRMSYWLNWHGPSEPIDTACSSSLVAVHRAVELLRSGQCTQAVVGGVNTLLSASIHESFTQAGMLAPDGRCKTFSAQADGYVRGEGAGMLFLKPLSAAERDGDHIYGVIKGSATNHGGRAHSLTAPNPRAQADLIKTALRQANVE
ncbi:SDR family NAD(P)-dependent oxidoreductase, partial [Glaciimonas sp. GG7]